MHTFTLDERCVVCYFKFFQVFKCLPSKSAMIISVHVLLHVCITVLWQVEINSDYISVVLHVYIAVLRQIEINNDHIRIVVLHVYIDSDHICCAACVHQQ